MKGKRSSYLASTSILDLFFPFCNLETFLYNNTAFGKGTSEKKLTSNMQEKARRRPQKATMRARFREQKEKLLFAITRRIQHHAKQHQ